MSAERWVRNGRPPSYYGRRGGCNLSEAEENEAAQQGSVYVVPSQFEAASGWRPSGMGSWPTWDPLDEVGSTERWGRRDARRGVAVRWCMQSPCDLHAISIRSPCDLHAPHARCAGKDSNPRRGRRQSSGIRDLRPAEASVALTGFARKPSAGLWGRNGRSDLKPRAHARSQLDPCCNVQRLLQVRRPN